MLPLSNPSSLPQHLNIQQVPATFPADVGQLRRLDGHVLTSLLEYYGEADEGSVRQRQNRLARAIGAYQIVSSFVE